MSNFIVSLYTEMTPNPGSLKFVLNKMLLAGQSVDFQPGDDTSSAPIASALMKLPFVKGVFIANNFITISKEASYEWFDIKPQLSEFIKGYINDGKEIVNEIPVKAPETANKAPLEEGDIEGKIKQLLDQYVKPAVEMDGGAIHFKSFEEGIVTVNLQGSCSGCPSSSVTLKAGIEGLLKRMIPEVKEVIAEST